MPAKGLLTGGAAKLKPVELGAVACWLELLFCPPKEVKDVLGFEDEEKLPGCWPNVKPLDGCCMPVEAAEVFIPHDGAGKLCDRGDACGVSGRA